MSYNYPFKVINDKTKLAIWAKGKVISQEGNRYAPDVWRHDICGTVMKYSEHGNTNSEYGWEIDHIKPTAKSGPNTSNNLQPLQWENNRKKGDSYPWSCP